MLLIDGVKYQEWTPTSEKEFERIVNEHASEIFGENSIYIDRKLKLQSLSGIGSIPDGYVIILRDSPHWHIVEVELSSHDLYNHIVPQVGKFINGINNLSTQKTVAEAIYHTIISEGLLHMRMDKVVQTGEIYKFVAELISKPPVITIVIERNTPELGDALSALAHPMKNVVELRTFTREGVGLAVHAHLFEPLYRPIISTELAPPEREIPVESMKLKVWRSYMEYEYIGIWKKHREFFPQYGATIELITDDGDIFRAKVGKSPAGSTELWGLRDWYSKNPDLKEGDLILITPVEPMKKYHIQTRRRQQ